MLAAAALTLVPVACGDDADTASEPALAGVVRDPALEVGSVQLTSSDGSTVSMKADPGELLVATFGYTFCPDICPTTLNDLSIVVNDLPDDLSDRVSVAFVTVDPERDTPEVLSSYVEAFFTDRGLGLHGADEAQLAQATEAFGVQFQIDDHEPGSINYSVAHTAVTYVIDERGSVIVEWPFGTEIDDMTSDLTTLLRSTDAAS